MTDDAATPSDLDASAERRRHARLWVGLFFPGLAMPFLGAAVALMAFFGVVDASYLSDGISSAVLTFVMTYGCAQLTWVGPVALATGLWRPTRGLALGLVVGAALVFLLQATCYGFVGFSLGSLH